MVSLWEFQPQLCSFILRDHFPIARHLVPFLNYWMEISGVYSLRRKDKKYHLLLSKMLPFSVVPLILSMKAILNY